MNYAVIQRMRFIDIALSEYGRVNRSVLIEYFGLSAASATKDLSTYQEQHPGNMIYSTKSKSYVATSEFERAYT